MFTTWFIFFAIERDGFRHWCLYRFALRWDTPNSDDGLLQMPPLPHFRPSHAITPLRRWLSRFSRCLSLSPFRYAMFISPCFDTFIVSWYTLSSHIISPLFHAAATISCLRFFAAATLSLPFSFWYYASPFRWWLFAITPWYAEASLRWIRLIYSLRHTIIFFDADYFFSPIHCRCRHYAILSFSLLIIAFITPPADTLSLGFAIIFSPLFYWDASFYAAIFSMPFRHLISLILFRRWFLTLTRHWLRRRRFLSIRHISSRFADTLWCLHRRHFAAALRLFRHCSCRYCHYAGCLPLAIRHYADISLLALMLPLLLMLSADIVLAGLTGFTFIFMLPCLFSPHIIITLLHAIRYCLIDADAGRLLITAIIYC